MRTGRPPSHSSGLCSSSGRVQQHRLTPDAACILETMRTPLILAGWACDIDLPAVGLGLLFMGGSTPASASCSGGLASLQLPLGWPSWRQVPGQTRRPTPELSICPQAYVSLTPFLGGGVCSCHFTDGPLRPERPVACPYPCTLGGSSSQTPGTVPQDEPFPLSLFGKKQKPQVSRARITQALYPPLSLPPPLVNKLLRGHE